MNCSIINKAKIFFVAALVVIVVGLSLFGFLGFNQSIDYKNGYELQVSVDQNAGSAIQIMNDTTEKYFSDNNVKPISMQVADDGLMRIYKFSSNVVDLEKGLQEKIDTAIIDANITNVSSKVEAKEVVAKDNTNVGRVLLAMAISIVCIFVYALILEKFVSAVSVAFSATLSAILFLAFMGATRIPAAPFVVISGALSVVLAGVISIATVNKYKKECKKADRATNLEIVEKVANKANMFYIIVGGAILLSAVALCCFGLPYLMIAGAQIAVAGISGITSAIFGTPFMWSLIKKGKK